LPNAKSPVDIPGRQIQCGEGCSGLTFAPGQLATLAAIAMLAALVSALTGTAILRRLKPTEILREA
jgi:hypothetical protein